MLRAFRRAGAMALLAAAVIVPPAPAGACAGGGRAAPDADLYAALAARDDHCLKAGIRLSGTGGHGYFAGLLAKDAPGCMSRFEAAYAREARRRPAPASTVSVRGSGWRG